MNKSLVVDGMGYRFQIWDTAGQEKVLFCSSGLLPPPTLYHCNVASPTLSAVLLLPCFLQVWAILWLKIFDAWQFLHVYIFFYVISTY